MSGRVYTEEEKQAYVEEFRKSELGSTAFAREIGVPESTLRTWVRENRNSLFGAIELQTHSNHEPRNIKKSTVFASENIRIELKEGFDKKFLLKIIEVLVND